MESGSYSGAGRRPEAFSIKASDEASKVSVLASVGMDFEEIDLMGTGGGWRLRFCRVETVKLRFVVKKDEVRITPSPCGVLEPRLPGFA